MKLWRTSDWQLLHTIRLEDGSGFDLAAAYSPDSKTVATGYYGIELHDVASGKLIRAFGPANGDGLAAISFTPDGQYVVALDRGYLGHPVIIWRVSDGKQMLAFGSGFVDCLAVSPDGKTAALGNSDSMVRLYRLSDGALLWSIGPLGNSSSILPSSINTLTFSPDGQRLAIGCYDETGGGAARLVNAATGALQHILSGAGTVVLALVFTPDGQTVLDADNNPSISSWDVPSGRPLGGMPAPQYGVPSIAVSPDGQTVVAGGEGSGLNVYNLPTRAQTSTTLSAHYTRMTTMALSSASGLMATAELAEGHLWSLASGKLLRSFTPPPGTVPTFNQFAFSPDGQTLAAANGDNYDIYLYRTSDPTLTPVILHGHQDAVNTLCFSPDGKTLASCSWDETIKVWRVADHTLLQTLTFSLQSRCIRCVAYSPDGSWLAAGNDAGTVLMFRTSDYTLARTFAAHDDFISGLAFSPDSRLLASAGGLHLNIERVADGQLQSSATGIERIEWANMTFTPDSSKIIALLSEANALIPAVNVFRTADGTVFDSFTEEVLDGAFLLAASTDGQTLGFARGDGTIGVIYNPYVARISSDLNGDGFADIVWQNQLTGDTSYWLLNGTQAAATGYIGHGAPLEWKVVGSCDLNGDGQPDLLWENQRTGDVSYWLMSGTTWISAGYLAYGVSLEWRIVGTPDLNNDGQADILWLNQRTGDVSYWIMNGTRMVSAGYIAYGVTANWKIVGTPDLNHDGHADILWQDQISGDVSYWLMNGLQRTGVGYIAHGIPTEWKIVGTPDYNNDGQPDLLWQNTRTGDVSYWLLNGTQMLSAGYLAYGITLDWKVAVSQ